MLKYQVQRLIASRFAGLHIFRSALFLPTVFVLTSFIIGSGEKELKIGKKAPLASEEMLNIDGQMLSLESLKKENGIVVIFSCNTCPFVVGNDDFEGWEKQYNDLFDKAAESNLGLVLVNSNEAKREGDDSLEAMQKHAKKMGYKMPYLVDVDSKLADAFGAKTTPHVYVLNAKNMLIYKGSIDNIWDSKRTETTPYLYDVMDHLTNGTALKNNDTSPRGCSIKRK
jgi:peroxiredoxin